MVKVISYLLLILSFFSLNGCSLTADNSFSTPTTQIVIPQVEPPQTVAIIKPQIEIAPPPLTPQQVESLWQRIAMQLYFEQPETAKIKRQIKWYLKHPTYMNRVAQRAQPFLHLIVDEIEKRQLPLELALLPIVESEFNPLAYSHGRASGMWQIISGTGKRFGLSQNWWYDGRRDVYASTHAALDYLEYLHKFFDGNWLHAIAAYNSGEGRVQRAIRKNKKAGKATDFWSLQLPKETKDYVPKLLALALLLKNQQHYGVTWPIISNQSQVILVDTQSQIDLNFAASLADIDVDYLRYLNPGFNRWATNPTGPHQLLLPVDKVEGFHRKLNQSAPKDRLNWVRYKIKSGDSLGLIAQRHQTTVTVVKNINGMTSNSIRAGKYLLIPISATTTPPTFKLPVKTRASTKTHVVKSGDNLWDIAKKYDVNYLAIATWNKISHKKTLRLGQKLLIKSSTSSTPPSEKKLITNIRYKVKRGDSIARIAQKFSLKITDVIRWNSLNTKKYLKPGQMLKLYINVMETNS